MVQETNAISGVTELGYDAAGNVVTVKDPVNSTTRYGYDGLSRLLSVTQPLGQTVRYEWDLRDRLAKKILARSALGGSSEHPEIRYTYESWGPLAFAKHYAKSSDTTPLKTISYVRNRAGDLTSVTDDSIQAGPLYTYEVDKLGRTTKTFAKYIPGGDRRLDYAYDARGDLVTFTLNEPNESLAHVYTYAADSGRIATALFPGESTALVIARWPHDGVRSIDYPGGVRREVDYDVRGPVSEIRIKPPSGTPLIEKWTYTYTDVLNVATMTDGASRETTYQYDALDRLTQADHPAMPAPLNSLPDVENFTYDGVGNRTMTGYAHDANHRMRESPGHTYDYDEDGNLVTRDPNTPGQVSHGWDLENRMASHATGSTTATYLHGQDARRVRRDRSGTSTYFLWVGDLLLSEYGSTGVRVARYAYLDEWSPDQVVSGSSLGSEQRRIAASDGLGTPRLMVSTSGAPQWRASYEAYGGAHIDSDTDGDLESVVSNVRFPGQYFEEESKSHYNRFRTYSPSMGRYLSRDPIEVNGKDSAYVYAGADPLSKTDPLGLFTFGFGWFGGGGAGAGAQTQSYLVLDDQGNVGWAVSVTTQAELGVTISTGTVLQVTSSDTINDTAGSGHVVGGGIGEGPIVGGDFIWHRGRDGAWDVGGELQLGIGGGTPIEAHAGPSITIIVAQINVGEALRNARAWWADLLRRRPKAERKPCRRN